ncbi:hypothetical protein E5358_12510 [Palleniella muris]|uniref:Uncharacterized protein n=1 Tax=Palleniella muris TaxID=3038145 RepID=A0AC61QML3_9BACT|nr:hypothetical protein [Palleniella muris]TGX80587.1 hypothetical protein E5358_12510 [Palleniella muris]
MKVDFFLSYYWKGLDETLKKSDISEIEKLMKDFFADKTYSEKVDTYSISLVCVIFDPEFDRISRPYYISDKVLNPPKGLELLSPVRVVKEFCCEILLEFTAFAYTSKEEGYNIIAHTVMEFLENLKYPVAIRKSFDKERFNNDMREFFRSIGCDV